MPLDWRGPTHEPTLAHYQKLDKQGLLHAAAEQFCDYLVRMMKQNAEFAKPYVPGEDPVGDQNAEIEAPASDEFCKLLKVMQFWSAEKWGHKNGLESPWTYPAATIKAACFLAEMTPYKKKAPNPNDPRDKFIYGQLKKTTIPQQELLNAYNKRAAQKGWYEFDDIQGWAQAGKRYAKRHGLAPPPRRRD